LSRWRARLISLARIPAVISATVAVVVASTHPCCLRGFCRLDALDTQALFSRVPLEAPPRLRPQSSPPARTIRSPRDLIRHPCRYARPQRELRISVRADDRTAARLRRIIRVVHRVLRPPASFAFVFCNRLYERDEPAADLGIGDAHEACASCTPSGVARKAIWPGATSLATRLWLFTRGAPLKKNSTGTPSTLANCCRRLAPMRLVPFSYLCTC
jgi:hypothetical protein